MFSKLAVKLREKIWTYALNEIPRKARPVATVSSEALLRVRKLIREEITWVVRRRDLEFWVVFVQRPEDLKTRVRKHTFLPIDEQRKLQYMLPRHMRIHICILAKGLLPRIRDDLYELEDELKAWRRPLRAFPIRKLHLISLSFDVFGSRRRHVETVHWHFIPISEYHSYDIGFLPLLRGCDNPPVVLYDFLQWLLKVLKVRSKEQCHLQLEVESEPVKALRRFF